MSAASRPDAAGDVLASLAARGQTLAVAESLTGGLLAATLTDVPGASAVFLGGVTAYATHAKVSVLDVPEQAVRSAGVVSADVATAMARGVRARFGATYALSTTGVAGPDRQEDKPVGTVFVAVVGPDDTEAVQLALTGDRKAIRISACAAALALLRRTLEPVAAPGDR